MSHSPPTPAELFKALGHPGRLALVRAIADGERCVCDLAGVIGVDVSTASRHLDQLRRARLVRQRREGPRVFYELASPATVELIALAASLETAGEVERA